MIASTAGLQEALEAHRNGDFQRAEAIYRRLIEESPNDANALHLMGVAALQQGDYQRAADFIRRAMQFNNSEPLFHSNLGAALRELEQLEEAISCFRRSVQLDPQFAGGHYNLALALEREERWDEAAESYSRAVEADPSFIDAYVNLGWLLSRQQKHEEAVKWFRRGLQKAPDHAVLHYNLGNALDALDRTEEAVAAFEEAIRLNPDVPEFHNNLGAALKKLEQRREAAACFEAAVRLDPNHAEARGNLAILRDNAECSASSLAELEDSLQLQPESVQTRLVLARSLTERGQIEKAAAEYEAALQLDENVAEVHFGLADVRLSQGRSEEAERHYRRGLELDADNVAAWNALGMLLVGQNQLAEAEDCYRTALVIDPENAVVCYNLGNVCKDSDRPEEALDYYDRALQLQPDLAEALINRGVVLRREGRLDESVASHERALQIRPGDAEARFHLALARLKQGDFIRGWADYEARWDYEGKRRHFPQPVWDGSSLSDHILLAYAEQGIGDEIMFASCLPEVLQQTAGCILECDPRLVPLFARSFPLARVVPRPFDARQAGDELPHCDRQIALGSLPRFLRQREDDFPRQRRFLAADPQLLRRWRTRLASLGEGLKVGISWRGGHREKVARERSTTLDLWKPLWNVSGVHFVNLQYGECRDELETVREQFGIPIADWDDVNPLKDLDSFAAEVAALDLVISVDNSTVHMAGALGVPVWTLLPFNANWRWLQERDESLWYSSMRLFRQWERGEWAPVFTQAAEELSRTAQQVPQLCKVESAGLTGDAQNDADVERRKYEHIWTHDAYRVLSPGLLDAEKVDLVTRLRDYECRTVLDAGCGSGKLMRKLMTEYGDEFEVHGFDISDNCLDPFFDEIKDEVLRVGCLWHADDMPGTYDAVICTDVMEHIPTEHVPAVLENLRRCTGKFAYLAIALFPDGFGPKLIGEPLHLTVKPPKWWFARLSRAGYRIVQHFVETHPSGQEMWLHVFLEV